MAEIFQELYRVLEPGGVMTVMFTHKESSAWDTLTKSLIRSGFTVTSTHPITSEMPQRTDTRGGGSADSTLLLTGRKPVDANQRETDSTPTLWVKSVQIHETLLRMLRANCLIRVFHLQNGRDYLCIRTNAESLR